MYLSDGIDHMHDIVKPSTNDLPLVIEVFKSQNVKIRVRDELTRYAELGFYSRVALHSDRYCHSQKLIKVTWALSLSLWCWM